MFSAVVLSDPVKMRDVTELFRHINAVASDCGASSAAASNYDVYLTVGPEEAKQAMQPHLMNLVKASCFTLHAPYL